MIRKRSTFGPLRIAIITSLALIIGIVGLLLNLNAREREQRARVEHTYEVIGALRDIQSSASEAEIATRAFLPEDDDSRLAPYQDATSHLASEFKALNTLVNDNQQLATEAATLEETVNREFNVLDLMVGAVQHHDQASAQQLAEVGEDAALAEKIRARVADIEAEERAVLESRERELDRTRSEGQFTALGLLLIAVAWVATALRMSSAKERQRRTAEDEALRMREEADKANKAKSRFLAMMSHELRTPMAGVLGLADLLLLDDGSGEERLRLTKQLKRSALSLLDILNDILDFSKIEAGKLEIDHEPFSLGDVLMDLRGLFAPAASVKGLVFEVTASEGLPDAFKGDAKRLRQIIVNLVNNAIKFTSQGRIDLRISYKKLDGGGIELCGSVQDTGIGISKESIAKLFQPFVQADASTSRNFGGTGLGLTIARLLTSAMNGRIWVESELSKGTTFFFTIPLEVIQTTINPIRIQERRSHAVRARRPLSILFAEDTETVRQITIAMLTRMGHSVDAVENGAAAVEKVKTRNYDIILMDMQMPVMDGLDATKTIRTLQEGKRTPIIALTADAIYEHRQKYLSGGVDAIVTKPIDWDLLVAKFAQLVPEVEVPAIVDRRKAPEPEDLTLDTSLLGQLDKAIGRQGLIEFLKTGRRNAQKYLNDTETNLSDGDLTGAKKAAHALKGLLSQMGAQKAAASAKTIEIEAVSLDDARKWLEPLKLAIEEVLAEISNRYEDRPVEREVRGDS